MLSHSIKKPASKVFQDELERRRAARQQGVPFTRGATPALPAPAGPQFGFVPVPWTKARFIAFTEAAQALYPIGSLVTLRHVMVIPNQIPRWLFEVVYISELYHDTQFDAIVGEPRGFVLRPFDGSSNVTKCAGTLRQLTKEELALVDLSNKKAARIVH